MAGTYGYVFFVWGQNGECIPQATHYVENIGWTKKLIDAGIKSHELIEAEANDIVIIWSLCTIDDPRHADQREIANKFGFYHYSEEDGIKTKAAFDEKFPELEHRLVPLTVSFLKGQQS